MKNTSSPWTWKENEALIGHDNALIFGILRTPAERDANKRIVANAPLMAEALQAIITLLSGKNQPKDIPGALMVAQSVISKL